MFGKNKSEKKESAKTRAEKTQKEIIEKAKAGVNSDGDQVKVKHNEPIQSQQGAKPEPKKLTLKEKMDVNEGMHKMLDRFDVIIPTVRKFREKIDFVMKVIELTGMQNEIVVDVKGFNPIEHSLVNLTLAKGGLGEILKLLIPQIDLIGLKCYNNYIQVCKELGEDPTYKDEVYPFLPQGYMDGLYEAIKDALKNEVTAEENHKKWMESKLKDDWKFGEVKDAEKKIHPSLISYDQLPEGERKKGEEFLRIIKEFKNPYKYPKQKGSDVENVANSVVVDNLEIDLPEGMYEQNGIPVTRVSGLNRVQTVDYIKFLLSKIIEEFIKFKFVELFSNHLNLYNKYNDNRINISTLSAINVQATYHKLVDAKNIFGYTFQYYK